MGSSQSLLFAHEMILIHQKQRIIFDAFCRVNIFVNIKKKQIPVDIINQCFAFYEVQLLAFLKITNGQSKSQKDNESTVYQNYRKSGKYNFYHDDFIDFEIAKVFINSPAKYACYNSHRVMAWMLNKWKQYKEAEILCRNLL